MNFQEAHDYLNSLQMHKIKLGLDSMASFLDKVERPEKKLKFVHVAGTNGKGSVSMNIVSIMSEAGYRVGLFTSPHLSSVRERFRVGDRFISEEEFARIAGRVRDVLGEDLITYFEFTTALALLWFLEQEVDLVVLETGLGGRLDATNIVSPLVTVITNVSMDHEAYLGNDLGSIAFEKAGIIKPETPLVTGVQDQVCLDVIKKRCEELDAPMYLYGRDFLSQEQQADSSDNSWSWSGEAAVFAGEKYTDLHCGMKGAYQVDNSSLAVAVLLLLHQHGYEVSAEYIKEGLAGVLWPGRLEYIQLDRSTREQVDETRNSNEHVRYLMDGAHNPAGMESLVATLSGEYSFDRLLLIWGAMEDKDLLKTLLPVANISTRIVLTRPDGERSADPQMLHDILPGDLQAKALLQPDVKKALVQAEDEAGVNDLIVVAGSLYLVGEVRKFLLGELVS